MYYTIMYYYIIAHSINKQILNSKNNTLTQIKKNKKKVSGSEMRHALF